MPYIANAKEFDKFNEGVEWTAANNPGELNYLITQLLINYTTDNGICYQTCNDVVGALEGAKAEFQRRIVNPYEDKKIKLNGDVYDVLDELMESVL